MVEPITVGILTASAVSSLVSIGMSYSEAQKKAAAIRKLDAETQKRMVAALKKLEENWQLPSGRATPLSFEEFKLVGQYTPEVAQQIKETKPGLIQERGSAREIASQRGALADYELMAQSGDDAISRAARESAQFEADSALKSRRAQILRDRAASGMLNSGDALLSELSAADSGAVSQRQAASQAAAQAQQRRMQALAGQTGLATSMRDQNRAVESANINIMNAFNQRMASNQNAYNQYKTGVLNNAQAANLTAAQRVADANTAGRTNRDNTNIARQDATTANRITAQNDLARTSFAGATRNAAMAANIGANNISMPTGNQIIASGLGSLGQTGLGVGARMAAKPPTNNTNTGGPDSNAGGPNSPSLANLYDYDEEEMDYIRNSGAKQF